MHAVSFRRYLFRLISCYKTFIDFRHSITCWKNSRTASLSDSQGIFLLVSRTNTETMWDHSFVFSVLTQRFKKVIQKLIDTVAPERLTFLRIISLNIPDLAASSTGCRVLQRCLSKLPKAQVRPVLDAIDQHCDILMRDQYGVRYLSSISNSVTNKVDRIMWSSSSFSMATMMTKPEFWQRSGARWSSSPRTSMRRMYARRRWPTLALRIEAC